MEPETLYLIKASISLIIFYFGYSLFMERITYFNFQRFYLVAAIVTSLALPMTRFGISLNFGTSNKTVQTESVKSKITDLTIQEEESGKSSKKVIDRSIHIAPIISAANTKKDIDFYTLFMMIYCIGFCAFFTRFCTEMIRIAIIYRKSIKQRKDGIYLMKIPDHTESFSFFNLVFINESDKSHEELEKIIFHERIHVRQLHTVDVLITELCAILLWFNPAVWLIKSSLTRIHEYQADEGVLKSGFDRLQYQALLINQAAEDGSFILSSNFNHSLIKKRLIMMTKSKSAGSSKLRILTLIPIVLAIFFCLSVVNGKPNDEMPPPKANSKDNNKVGGIPVTLSKNLSDDKKIIDSNLPETETTPLPTDTIKGKKDQKNEKDFIKRLSIEVDSMLSHPVLITQDELLGASGILDGIIFLKTKEKFKVTQFTISADINENLLSETSNSGNFTAKQLDIIKKIPLGRRFLIENLTIKFQDGKTKHYPILAYRIIKKRDADALYNSFTK